MTDFVSDDPQNRAKIEFMPTRRQHIVGFNLFATGSHKYGHAA